VLQVAGMPAWGSGLALTGSTAPAAMSAQQSPGAAPGWLGRPAREYRPGPGQPHPGRGSAAHRVGGARARPPPGPGGHQPGRPDRRLADQPERTVDTRDLLRGVRPAHRVFAETAYARRWRWKPGYFSFNTREGQCPGCRGLGHIDLDVQYLPGITVGCPLATVRASTTPSWPSRSTA